MIQTPTFASRNNRRAPALVQATYSQARAAMRLLISLLLAWPRTATAVVRIGAVALLFYAASLYTRDWRAVVPPSGQVAAVQAPSRPKAEPRSSSGKLAELPLPVEPTTTGTPARITPAVVAPAAEPAAMRRPAPAPTRLQARSATPRSPKQMRPTRGTQVAARPAVTEPSPVGPSPSILEKLFQFRLADRGN